MPGKKKEKSSKKRIKYNKTAGNFIDIITESQENWYQTTTWIEIILKQKEKDERDRQKRNE